MPLGHCIVAKGIIGYFLILIYTPNKKRKKGRGARNSQNENGKGLESFVHTLTTIGWRSEIGRGREEMCVKNDKTGLFREV
jgi:hypothetical protein